VDRFGNELDSAVAPATSLQAYLVQASADARTGLPASRSARIACSVADKAQPNTDGRYVVSYDPVMIAQYILNVEMRAPGCLLATYNTLPRTT
jgi:hypothetical protein